MPPGAIAAAFQLANLILPGAITLFETIKNKDGSLGQNVSIFVTLDQNDSKFDANLAELVAEKAKLAGKKSA